MLSRRPLTDEATRGREKEQPPTPLVTHGANGRRSCGGTTRVLLFSSHVCVRVCTRATIIVRMYICLTVDPFFVCV